MRLSQLNGVRSWPGDLNTQASVNLPLVSDVKEVSHFFDDGSDLGGTGPTKDAIVGTDQQRNCGATAKHTFVHSALGELELVDQAICQVPIPHSPGLSSALKILL